MTDIENRRPRLGITAAVTIVGLVGILIHYLLTVPPAPLPQYGSSVADVTVTVAPTATVTATVVVPGPVRTVTVSRAKTRKPASGSVWDRLAQCESGGRWDYNGGSGYDGGLQFLPRTWTAYKPSGYPAYAWQASREQQIAVAVKVQSDQGWGAWPACTRKLGIR